MQTQLETQRATTGDDSMQCVRTMALGKSQSNIMRVKVLSRNPDDYLQGTKKDIPIHKGAFVAITFHDRPSHIAAIVFCCLEI